MGREHALTVAMTDMRARAELKGNILRRSTLTFTRVSTLQPGACLCALMLGSFAWRHLATGNQGREVVK